MGVEGEGEDERNGEGELSGRSRVALRETVDWTGAGEGEGDEA